VVQLPKITIKVNIKSTDSNENYTRIAIIQDQILKYVEKEDTITKFDYQNNILIRENKEFKMEYLFDINKITKGTFLLKENNQIIEIPINTKELVKNKNNIKIKFEIENNQFLYEIEEIK